MDNEPEADPFGENEPVETNDAPPEAAPQPEEQGSEAAPAAPEPAPIVPEAKPDSPQPGFVPFAAVLDERDKRKAAEAEIAKYRQQQEAKEPEQSPDPWTDPEGAIAFQQKQFDTRLNRAISEQQQMMSYRFATVQHGKEATDEAVKWGFDRCAADPWFNAQVMQSGDPVGFVVQNYNQSKVLEQVDPGQLEQFRAWREAQAALTAQQQPQATPQPAAPEAVAAPPKSIADLPSAGSAGVAKPDPSADKVTAMFG